MSIQEYYPLIIMVSVITAAIAVLRIFFTFWTPVERKINGDRLRLSNAIHVNELKEKMVNIHTTSKNVIENVMLLGVCRASAQAPYDLKQLLMAQFSDGRKVYIKMATIEYMEEV